MGKVKALALKIENPNRMNGFGIGFVLFCFSLSLFDFYG
jgi:hypothetical protein